jgi:hypothetical protein
MSSVKVGWSVSSWWAIILWSQFFENLKQFTKGIWCCIADKKAIEGDITIIGKKMGFDVYKKICDLFLKEEEEEFIFAQRSFLWIEWNLMARSKNVVNVQIFHVEWNADCIIFWFIKSKGDQTEQNSDQERHMYANPHHPHTKICPLLALVCYLFPIPGMFSATVVEDKVVEGGWGGRGEGGIRKDTYSLEEISMTNSWTTCTLLWQSISKSFLSWVSCQAILGCTQQGKAPAANLQ